MFYQLTLEDICTILEAVDRIPRPYGDNEGDAVNSDTVYPYLAPEHQEIVDCAIEMLHVYTRVGGGQPNNRSITYLQRRGYSASLGQDQYDPYRIVGYVGTQNWVINISDSPSETEEPWD